MNSKRRLYWMVPAAMAAAVALMLSLFPDVQETKQPTSSPDPIAAVVEVERAEEAYRQAIASLEEAVQAEDPAFEPQTMEIVTKSLDEVDAAIERSRQAMERDPGNVEAVRALLAAYQQKVDLLTELVEQRI